VIAVGTYPRLLVTEADAERAAAILATEAPE
jgi:hypothetical protein